jgi:hypothetical protein
VICAITLIVGVPYALGIGLLVAAAPPAEPEAFVKRPLPYLGIVAAVAAWLLGFAWLLGGWAVRASLSAEVIDREPLCEAEIDAKRLLLLDQAREMGRVHGEKVTCPCGFAAPVVFAFQCFECGIWFCRSCAGRHFGLGGDR